MPARILVLDDEPAIQEFLTRLLQGAGNEVALQPDPLRALESLQGGQYAWSSPTA
jgi:CheY-like chemotaxis protein